MSISIDIGSSRPIQDYDDLKEWIADEVDRDLSAIEAKLEKGRGPIATVLVQEGTLKKGDALVSSIYHGRVRMMLNDRGDLIDEVKPGYSAEVIGLSGVPTAGGRPV